MQKSTISVYLKTRTSLWDKICAIDEIINNMELKLVDFAAGQAPEVQEYRMNDGQMTIQTFYRSIPDFERGIAALRRLKEYYMNQYNGRSFVLRDASKMY